MCIRDSRNWTGEKPNELYAARGRERGWDPVPGYIGLGFSLRGTAMCRNMFGTLASPGTFGNYGAGTTLFWIDPERDLSFTFLSAGLMAVSYTHLDVYKRQASTCSWAFSKAAASAWRAAARAS